MTTDTYGGREEFFNPKDWIGKTIDGFHIDEILGSGGEGCVFRATVVDEDGCTHGLQLGQTVAIKRFGTAKHLNFGKLELLTMLFSREGMANVVGGLLIPQLPDVKSIRAAVDGTGDVGSGDIDKELLVRKINAVRNADYTAADFLGKKAEKLLREEGAFGRHVVMVFEEGTTTFEDLFTRVPDGHARALITLLLLEGIIFMHEIGVPHGDLKPSNVLIVPSDFFPAGGYPVMIDFGAVPINNKIGEHFDAICNSIKRNDETVLPDDCYVDELPNGTTTYTIDGLVVAHHPEHGISVDLSGLIGEIRNWITRGYTPKWSRKRDGLFEHEDSRFDDDVYACAKLIEEIVISYEEETLISFTQWLVKEIDQNGLNGSIQSAFDLHSCIQFIAIVLGNGISTFHQGKDEFKEWPAPTLQYRPFYSPMRPNPKLANELVNSCNRIATYKSETSVDRCRLLNNLGVFLGHVGFVEEGESLARQAEQQLQSNANKQNQSGINGIPNEISRITILHNLAGFAFSMGDINKSKEVAFDAMELWANELNNIEKLETKNLALNALNIKFMREESKEKCNDYCKTILEKICPDLVDFVKEIDQEYYTDGPARFDDEFYLGKTATLLFGSGFACQNSIWTIAAVCEISKEEFYCDAAECTLLLRDDIIEGMKCFAKKYPEYKDTWESQILRHFYLVLTNAGSTNKRVNHELSYFLLTANNEKDGSMNYEKTLRARTLNKLHSDPNPHGWTSWAVSSSANEEMAERTRNHISKLYPDYTEVIPK